MKVREIMTKDVITVEPEMDIHTLAKLFVTKDISGAPVVNSGGTLLGIVREEGLIFQDTKVHLPTFVSLSVGFLALGTKRLEEEIRKITARSVADIMEKNIVTIPPDMEIEDVATMMIERGIYYISVVENNTVIGVVTKKDIVRAIAKSK